MQQGAGVGVGGKIIGWGAGRGGAERTGREVAGTRGGYLDTSGADCCGTLGHLLGSGLYGYWPGLNLFT